MNAQSQLSRNKIKPGKLAVPGCLMFYQSLSSGFLDLAVIGEPAVSSVGDRRAEHSTGTDGAKPSCLLQGISASQFRPGKLDCLYSAMAALRQRGSHKNHWTTADDFASLNQSISG